MMVVSLEQHCCLADLGIRRNTLPLGIVAIDGEGGREGGDGATPGAAGKTLAYDSLLTSPVG
jgi:hypothetical protein